MDGPKTGAQSLELSIQKCLLQTLRVAQLIPVLDTEASEVTWVNYFKCMYIDTAIVAVAFKGMSVI